MILQKYLYDGFGYLRSLTRYLLNSLGTILFSRKAQDTAEIVKQIHGKMLRGKHRLVTGTHNRILCDACGLCAKNCPAKCIEVVGEGEGKLKSFQIELLRCSFCGLCVEICPIDALEFTSETKLAGFAEQNWIMDKNELAYRPELNA